MIQDNIYSMFMTQFSNWGKEQLSKIFPRDFEVYMCALELVDDNNNPVDYFMFPIMPKSISKNENEATTIQNSFSGITIFNKDGYIPDDIVIQGDFGRSFKFISFGLEHYFKAIAGYSIQDGYYSSNQVNSKLVDKKMEFPLGIKTGFGCIKVLQAIINKAKAHGPTGKTYKLYFYNSALGESYLVVPTKNPLTFSQQEQSSNMIWQYNLSLSIIADLNDVTDHIAVSRPMQYSFSVDKVLGGITSPRSLIKNYHKK